MGNRRNFRRGIKNALRPSRNVRVSRYGWIGRLGLFGDLRCPETTTHLNRGTGGSVERIRIAWQHQQDPAAPLPIKRSTTSTTTTTIRRRAPECGLLEKGIKRDALLTSAMRPCRLTLALTLTLPQAPERLLRVAPRNLKSVTTFPMACRELGQTRESQCCTESKSLETGEP
jgi:hypothetical protein